MENAKRILGCIADDFTGASDAASFLQKAGLTVVLLSGVPRSDMVLGGYDALVVALKTRTEPVQEAVEHSMEAVKWLEKQGATQYYFKYCSTFDSTREGNIGPILDAALEYFNEPYTILCPALPVNGRKVVDGHLYVNEVPLHESPMKDHPLTPMWDSRIKNLMEAQSKYSCFEIGSAALAGERLEETLADWQQKAKRFYIVPDYQTDKDGENIARHFGRCKVLSGGSGILEHLEKRVHKGIVLAGSCSKATLNQIDVYQKAGHPSFKIDPVALWEGKVTVEEILSFIRKYPEEYVLVYSSDAAENVRQVQKLGKEQIASLLETTMGRIANTLVQEGYQHVIVAGGETSGAVTRMLGFHSFRIGKSVAPGVPMMTPVENKDIRLVLKSGNFGQSDFFQRAIDVVRGE